MRSRWDSYACYWEIKIVGGLELFNAAITAET